MKNILGYFIKEELNLHKSLTASSNFYSYPIMLFFFFLTITYLSNIFFNTFNSKTIGLYAISILFIGGIMSGVFGIYARDFLERKFGDIGRLFQNALIQPIKLNKLFMTIAISDSFFYLLWFIIPTTLGYGLGVYLIEKTFYDICFLLLSNFMAFFAGLLTSFILSLTFNRSKLFFSIILLIIVTIICCIPNPQNIINYSPFHQFFIKQNFTSLISSLLLVFVLFCLALLSVGKEFKTTIKNSVKLKSISFDRKIDKFIIKDYIDLKRTGDIIGKPLFTVFIPSILVLLIFSNSSLFNSSDLGVIFFSIIIGTLGTQLFNSLITSDNMAYYNHLPIKLKDFIKPKMIISLTICFIESLIILIAYSYIVNDFNNIISALIITLGLLIYNFNLSFYLTGLNPNENLMHTKIFLQYFILLMPILILIIAANMFIQNFMIIYSILFLSISYLLSKLLFKLGLKKWENKIINY